ncbi:unnamed protein product [[Candida] boidinii]|nr:unnamed protein product [[Candida] boidinii]
MMEFMKPQPAVNENSWSSLTWDQVGDNELLAYCSSKKLAEEAAWEFMKTESPNFALTTITAPYSLVLNSIDPSTTEAQKEGSAVFADARDVAFAHVAPLSTTSMNNKRILPYAASYCTQTVLNSMNKVPVLKGKVAVGEPHYCDTEEYKKSLHVVDNSESVKLLGHLKFISLDKCVADIYEQYYRVNNL